MIFLISILICQSYAWWNTGHELVAKIAELDLISTYDDIVFDSVIQTLTPLSPLLGETDNFWIEAAIYPDEMDEKGAT